MKSRYSYSDIEKILEKYNLYIYEHLNGYNMTKNYFSIYNTFNPKYKMKAPNDVNYCLAVKR